MAAKYFGNGLKENMSRLRKVFSEGINSVQPQELIKQFVKREGGTLIINNEKHKLNHNVYIVGFGKAVLGIARPLETLLKTSNSLTHLKRGILSVPKGIQDTFADRPLLLPSDDSIIEIIEGAENNIPDESAFNAAKRITSLVQTLTEEDLLIILISGGGSALLPYPHHPLTLPVKREIISSLSRSGASIIELNTVRKALSSTKGGKLAAMTKARTITLILSDIINSPLDMIASGPTVVNNDSVGAAWSVLEKYNVSIPNHIRVAMQSETPCISHQEFLHVTNLLIGSNETALSAVSASISKLMDRDDGSLILSSSLEGEASVVGLRISEFAATVANTICNDVPTGMLTDSMLTELCVGDTMKRRIVDILEVISTNTNPICFIFGGETTVKVQGTGLGGRNQEMVLSTSINLEKVMNGSNFKGEIIFLSGGTDGIDGPTDAAGAITYWIDSSSGISSPIEEAKQQNLDPEEYLKNNDSYTYFSLLNNGQYLLKPGHTGTNVMDIQILLICPRS